MQFRQVIQIAACLSVFLVAGISYGVDGERTAEKSDASRMQRARSRLEEGDLACAEELFQKCVAEAREEKDDFAEAVARKWLGVTIGRFGYARFKEARTQLERARQSFRRLTQKDNRAARRQEAFVCFDLAQLYMKAAEGELKQSLLSGISKSYFELVKTYVNPAQTCIEGAEQSYPDQRKADLEIARGDLKLLMARYARVFLPKTVDGERFQTAGAAYAQALTEEQKRAGKARGDVLAQASIGRGICHRQRAVLHDSPEKRRILHETAIADFSRALDCKTSDLEQKITAAVLKASTILDRRATGATSDGRALRVEKLLKKAARQCEQMRQDVARRSSYSRTVSFFSQRTAVYEQLVRLHAVQGRSEKMLWATERMKARAFREKLKREGESRKKVSPEGGFDLGDTVGRLRKDNGMLTEYFYGPRYAWMIMVLPDGSVTHREIPLQGQTLVKKLRKVMRGYSNGRLPSRYLIWMRRTGTAPENIKKVYAESHELYKKLMEPVYEVAEEKDVDVIYMVPHHLMHYTPFCALVASVDEKDPIYSTYCLEAHEIPLCYLPAASVLPALESSSNEMSSLIMARADFSNVQPGYPSDLNNSVAEAEKIAAMIPGDLLTENRATEKRFRDMGADRSILYFATHGVLKTSDPLDSAILLAESEGRGHRTDGRLTVRELISDLHGRLSADLVVLSACQTNKARLSPVAGDDLAALSRGFMIAGGESIIATQWNASDDVFPKIMTMFVEEMKRGVPKAKALHVAMQKFLAQKDVGIHRYPMFWAPIVMIGSAQ